MDRRPANGLWTIVLAAGGSTRLGHPKQLLRSRGRTLVSRAVALGEAVTPARVIVVVGAERLRIVRHLRQHRVACTFADNPRWREGMSSSLAEGIRKLPHTAHAALILLTDQPGISLADLARLTTHWQRHRGRAAAAVYGGRAGVPAIIPARFFRRLMAGKNGDRGARDVLRDAQNVTRVAIPAAEFDVDTSADLARLR